MAVDIYFKVDEDPNFNNETLELNDDILLFLQQIEMILTTRKGDVLGNPEFGANLEDYIWSKYGSTQIENELTSQINIYCSEFVNIIKWSIKAYFVKGEIYDSILVDILIEDNKVLGIYVGK